MYLGIDLGTSNSAIVGNIDSELKLFKTADGSDVLPSAIYVAKGGRKFVGKRAYEQAIHSPENVAQGFKRLMGTSSPIYLAAAGMETSPEECSAEIIRTLMTQARTEAGDFEATGAVVTIPAAFNQMQSQATIRAAEMAGLDRVGLLQEPIAAAMASMAGAKNRNGQFLVYDLGGGTFDVALVQSLSGSVNVVAHEGINMLGGRDFDRLLVDAFVRPWLMENFSLPQNFQADGRYRRLAGIARYAAERAKIDLSTAETAVIYAADGEVRVADEEGSDIYLSIDVSRKNLESLVVERVEESIALCRKMLKDNGYSHEDIDRIVLIGGPSKTPLIRTRVPQELGIPADLQTDPMTAVAVGAAIFAESREWLKGTTKRKASRASSTVTGPVEIRYDFAARTSEDRARIRVRPAPDVVGKGYRLQIDTMDGWTSGEVEIANDLSVEVPVPDRGENRFRITVFDSAGAPITGASTEIAITRTHASAAGIPATQTLAVKVVETASGRETNELEPLVAKGTLLPASGSKAFRAATDLSGGQPRQIDVEIFEQAEGVPEPELNLFVGAFRIDGKADLEDGDRLRKGEKIVIHWEMDDNGLLKCAIEVPCLGRTFDTRNFYTSNLGHQNFEGADGEALASDILAAAERDIESVETTLGGAAASKVGRLRQRAGCQRETLSRSGDADSRRSVTEEARSIRQELSRLKHAPENRGKVLLRELAEIEESFDGAVRENAEPTSVTLFERLAGTVRQSIRNGDMAEAERGLKEMEHILFKELWRSPGYLLLVFKTMTAERHLAVDKAMHDELVAEGERAAAANDVDELRRVVVRMYQNRFTVTTDRVMARMASLMRG